jgi:alanyl-tRNA synthetase
MAGKAASVTVTAGKAAVREHAVVPSSPLVPENDPTHFIHRIRYAADDAIFWERNILKESELSMLRSVLELKILKRCDNRHTTFEMLGNWSLGIISKPNNSPGFTLLTKIVGLEPAKLYITVFVEC